MLLFESQQVLHSRLEYQCLNTLIIRMGSLRGLIESFRLSGSNFVCLIHSITRI